MTSGCCASPTSRSRSEACAFPWTSAEILDLLRDSVDSYGQTTVMVTHDPRAAAIADRILFLADGLIVSDLGPSTAHEILEALDEVTTR